VGTIGGKEKGLVPGGFFPLLQKAPLIRGGGEREKREGQTKETPRAGTTPAFYQKRHFLHPRGRMGKKNSQERVTSRGCPATRDTRFKKKKKMLKKAEKNSGRSRSRQKKIAVKTKNKMIKVPKVYAT